LDPQGTSESKRRRKQENLIEVKRLADLSKNTKNGREKKIEKKRKSVPELGGKTGKVGTGKTQ